MILNALDDPICSESNIPYDFFEQGNARSDVCILLTTKRGSHVSHLEGVLGGGCYSADVTLDFFETVIQKK